MLNYMQHMGQRPCELGCNCVPILSVQHIFRNNICTQKEIGTQLAPNSHPEEMKYHDIA